jgi:hypothetical protein
MDMKTLDQAVTLRSEIEQLDANILQWEAMQKTGMAYIEGETAYRFEDDAMPDAVFDSFRQAMLEALETRKLQLLEDLESL